MKDCLFCRIIRGEIPSTVLFRDEQVVAFKDINPQAPSHVLIVPVSHVASLEENEAANEKTLGAVFRGVQKLAKELKLEKGFRVVANCGSYAGQSVDHVHFHLLGGRPMAWPPG